MEVSPSYYRLTEVELLSGNPLKAQTNLNWSAKTQLKDLVKTMIKADLKYKSQGN